MTLYCDYSLMPSQCGGRLIHDFNFNFQGHSLREISEMFKDYMLVATFNEHQQAAYEACCKQFTWLGQSVPIKNPDTGNYIFTVIFKG